MHREFRRLLQDAKGFSQQIVAINLDIRGFTPFCEKRESFDVAAYISLVYMKIIDRYFSYANFYKPTGDGLLVIVLCEKKVEETVNKTIESCLKLLEDFCSLCEGEELIYFRTPDKIGIGLARGSACCIVSEDKILDYSGRMLNLASRLMDIARPSGIVFDSSLGFNLLSKEKKALFSEETVYVRGIAEEKPIRVYRTKTYTLIPDFHKNPIKEPRWHRQEFVWSPKDLKRMRTVGGTLVWFTLDHKPLDKDQIIVGIYFELDGLPMQHFFDVSSETMSYRRRGTVHQITLDLDRLLRFLELHGTTEDTKLAFSIYYPVKQ